MFEESFGFPWESIGKSELEEFRKLSLEEQITEVCRSVLGDNPDINDPLVKKFYKVMDFIREHAKEEE